MYYIWHWVVFLIYMKNAAAMPDQDQNEYLNDEEWVNPFDMINYDRASKSMLKSSLGVTGGRKDNGHDIDMLISEVKSLKNEVERCKAAFTNCSRHVSTITSEVDSSLVSSSSSPTQSSTTTQQQTKSSSNKQECERNKYFMRRFVNLFLKASKLTEEMPPSLETHVEVKVSLEQLTILQQFGKGSSEVSLQELDDVFSNILIGSTTNVVLDYLTWLKPESFVISVSTEMLLTCILMFLPLVCLWKILRGHKVVSILPVILFTIFITSFSITYYKMYKEAEIKQYHAMQKNLERQTECRSVSELSWFEMLRLQISSKRDECEELHRKAILEPFFEVTPALVLSQMLSESLLLHPAANLGSAIAEFSKPILGKLPFMTNYIVLVGSLFMIIMGLFLCIGGRINLPFFLGSFELSNRERPAAAVHQAQVPSQTPSIQEHVDHKTVKHMIRKEVVRALSVGSAPLHQEKVMEVKHLSETADAISETGNEGEVHKPCCCGDSVHLQLLDHKACLDGNDLHQEVVLIRDADRKSSLKGRKCSPHIEDVKTGIQFYPVTSRAQCDCQCSSEKKHSIAHVRKITKRSGKTQRLKRDSEEEQSSENSDESTES